ncbi:hypothetical protein [Palleronia sp. LCG004]|uniref:hypothetical protein n=1 Tax=Palleronia sp. LCG004 TaxID=3079304 RepID=UPI00294330CF|nr:hypothetical protein [Palleronia sp. LCG004]WOI55118.1 hypothetical protein RVY76_08595 [Palleronia sp. LCG004]
MDYRNLAAGNAEAMPALLKHVSDMQCLATRLHAVMGIVTHLDNEEACPEGRVFLCNYAEDLADKLSLGLDQVNLPLGRANQ